MRFQAERSAAWDPCRQPRPWFTTSSSVTPGGDASVVGRYLDEPQPHVAEGPSVHHKPTATKTANPHKRSQTHDEGARKRCGVHKLGPPG
jgi:hypothetical protein